EPELESLDPRIQMLGFLDHRGWIAEAVGEQRDALQRCKEMQRQSGLFALPPERSELRLDPGQEVSQRTRGVLRKERVLLAELRAQAPDGASRARQGFSLRSHSRALAA